MAEKPTPKSPNPIPAAPGQKETKYYINLDPLDQTIRFQDGSHRTVPQGCLVDGAMCDYIHRIACFQIYKDGKTTDNLRVVS